MTVAIDGARLPWPAATRAGALKFPAAGSYWNRHPKEAE